MFRYLKNETKLARKRGLHRARIFLRYLFSRERKEPVFVLAARRTGSNLFLGYLNSVPGARFQNEPLNSKMAYGLRRRFITKRAALRHILHTVHACGTRVCGAKIILEHMADRRITVDDLKRLFPSAKFIVLYRRSLLDQFLSLRIAELTDSWEWNDRFRLPKKLRVDPAAYRKFCLETADAYRRLRCQTALRDALFLSYEELVADPQGVFRDTVFPLLGLPPAPVTSPYRKQNTKKPSEIISNYADIEPFLGEHIEHEAAQAV